MTESRSLDSLPYDVFYQIASTLDCHDLINLSRVNRNTYSLTLDESIARKSVQDSLLHTKEGRQAHDAKSGYRKAVGRLVDIKEAVATARPFSVSVIANGSNFLYNEGTLCYVHDHKIRVLDVHGAEQVEQVLGICNILCRTTGCCLDVTQLSLMNYSHGILTFMVGFNDREFWLLAIDLRRPEPPNCRRLRLRASLPSSERLFVRNDASYLYCGTQSSRRYTEQHNWFIQCVDLRTGEFLTQKPIQLENFAGEEVDETVCFGVHQGHLYAVSTQVDLEDETDFTSFYAWACLSPGKNMRREDRHLRSSTRIWRRQHREGPINDTWADLSLRTDEATGELMILECRREWRGGGSENCRTYYMQKLPSPDEIFKEDQQYDSNTQSDEPTTTDDSKKPAYERPRKRLRRAYHSEYEPDTEASQRQDFILAKTKYRTYNLSAATFIDLVNDPDPKSSERDRLRLRTVSRKRKCPIDEEGEEGERGLLFRPEFEDTDGRPVDHSEERFVSRGIHFWPPDDAPHELADLLCPSKAGKVHAIADERSLVYSANTDGIHNDDRAIVLINFDPRIKLPGLTHLPAAGKSPSQETAFMDDVRVQDTEDPLWKANSRKGRLSFMWEEPAMYRSINHGYWLR